MIGHTYIFCVVMQKTQVVQSSQSERRDATSNKPD